jgi:inorganic triphosphatase YgiF
MSIQIALKLNLPEAAQALFMRHPLLRRAVRRHSEALVGIHYDTRRLTLYRHGIALRLRKHGAGWLQTVKYHGVSPDRPSKVPQWDTPYLSIFDFAAVDDEAVRGVLEKPKLTQGLVALFETSFRRITWQLRPAANVSLLVMLDRGWIAANGRRAPISEVTIELLEGPPNWRYDIADELAMRVPLTPELNSKAERGYRLAQDLGQAPSRATPVVIAGKAHPLAAFRAIALNCLAHLHENHGGALLGQDPEYVHQMRVATRRLRAALRMFAPVLPEDFVDALAPPLRELMGTLGRTRDLDVLLTEIIGPVSTALGDDPRISALAGIVTDKRFAAHGETERFLARPEYGKLLLLAAALLDRPSLGEPASPTVDQPAPAMLNEFAQRRLRKLRRRTQQLAELARTDDPASLHALRIAIKRLRYAIEFFSPLMPKRSFMAAARQLAALQDKLGQLNDLANAGTVLMACAGSDPNLREAVALIGGWYGPHHAELLAAVPEQLAVVRDLRLPKLGKA